MRFVHRGGVFPVGLLLLILPAHLLAGKGGKNEEDEILDEIIPRHLYKRKLPGGPVSGRGTPKRGLGMPLLGNKMALQALRARGRHPELPRQAPGRRKTLGAFEIGSVDPGAASNGYKITTDSDELNSNINNYGLWEYALDNTIGGLDGTAKQYLEKSFQQQQQQPTTPGGAPTDVATLSDSTGGLPSSKLEQLINMGEEMAGGIGAKTSMEGDQNTEQTSQQLLHAASMLSAQTSQQQVPAPMSEPNGPPQGESPSTIPNDAYSQEVAGQLENSQGQMVTGPGSMNPVSVVTVPNSLTIEDDHGNMIGNVNEEMESANSRRPISPQLLKAMMLENPKLIGRNPKLGLGGSLGGALGGALGGPEGGNLGGGATSNAGGLSGLDSMEALGGGGLDITGSPGAQSLQKVGSQAGNGKGDSDLGNLESEKATSKLLKLLQQGDDSLATAAAATGDPAANLPNVDGGGDRISANDLKLLKVIKQLSKTGKESESKDVKLPSMEALGALLSGNKQKPKILTDSGDDDIKAADLKESKNEQNDINEQEAQIQALIEGASSPNKKPKQAMFFDPDQPLGDPYGSTNDLMSYLEQETQVVDQFQEGNQLNDPKTVLSKLARLLIKQAEHNRRQHEKNKAHLLQEKVSNELKVATANAQPTAEDNGTSNGTTTNSTAKELPTDAQNITQGTSAVVNSHADNKTSFSSDKTAGSDDVATTSEKLPATSTSADGVAKESAKTPTSGGIKLGKATSDVNSANPGEADKTKIGLKISTVNSRIANDTLPQNAKLDKGKDTPLRVAAGSAPVSNLNRTINAHNPVGNDVPKIDVSHVLANPSPPDLVPQKVSGNLHDPDKVGDVQKLSEGEESKAGSLMGPGSSKDVTSGPKQEQVNRLKGPGARLTSDRSKGGGPGDESENEMKVGGGQQMANEMEGGQEANNERPLAGQQMGKLSGQGGKLVDGDLRRENTNNREPGLQTHNNNDNIQMSPIHGTRGDSRGSLKDGRDEEVSNENRKVQSYVDRDTNSGYATRMHGTMKPSAGTSRIHGNRKLQSGESQAMDGGESETARYHDQVRDRERNEGEGPGLQRFTQPREDKFREYDDDKGRLPEIRNKDLLHGNVDLDAQSRDDEPLRDKPIGMRVVHQHEAEPSSLADNKLAEEANFRGRSMDDDIKHRDFSGRDDKGDREDAVEGRKENSETASSRTGTPTAHAFHKRLQLRKPGLPLDNPHPGEFLVSDEPPPGSSSDLNENNRIASQASVHRAKPSIPDQDNPAEDSYRDIGQETGTRRRKTKHEKEISDQEDERHTQYPLEADSTQRPSARHYLSANNIDEDANERTIVRGGNRGNHGARKIPPAGVGIPMRPLHSSNTKSLLMDAYKTLLLKRKLKDRRLPPGVPAAILSKLISYKLGAMPRPLDLSPLAQLLSLARRKQKIMEVTGSKKTLVSTDAAKQSETTPQVIGTKSSSSDSNALLIPGNVGVASGTTTQSAELPSQASIQTLATRGVDSKLTETSTLGSSPKASVNLRVAPPIQLVGGDMNSTGLLTSAFEPFPLSKSLELTKKISKTVDDSNSMTPGTSFMLLQKGKKGLEKNSKTGVDDIDVTRSKVGRKPEGMTIDEVMDILGSVDEANYRSSLKENVPRPAKSHVANGLPRFGINMSQAKVKGHGEEQGKSLVREGQLNNALNRMKDSKDLSSLMLKKRSQPAVLDGTKDAL